MPRARHLTVTRVDVIDRKIHLIRHQKVLLDADLAVLYGVDTKALVQAVKRSRVAVRPDEAALARRSASADRSAVSLRFHVPADRH